MTWIDRINNIEFSITTGDNKVFKPLWKSGEKSREFNISEFDFIDVEGTLIDRKKPKSGKHTLVFWFEGEDNIEQAEEFEKSSLDSRSWIVRHPFYGDLIGQPVSLNRNDNDYNVTQVSVEFWETIKYKLPKTEISINDEIKQRTHNLASTSARSYASSPSITSKDQAVVKSDVIKKYTRYEKIINDTNSNVAEFNKIKSEALAKVDSIILKPVDAISSVNELIELPSQLLESVQTRLDLFVEIFKDIKEILNTGGSNNKRYFESTGSSVISGICTTVLNPFNDDYISRSEIESVSNFVTDIYTEYLTLIDASQSSEIQNSYSPNFKVQSELYSVITFTISNLFDLAFAAKQERIVQVEKDTNIILLVHKYIGLDKNDENINQFRLLNNIKNKSLFRIKKGRKIKYYV